MALLCFLSLFPRVSCRCALSSSLPGIPRRLGSRRLYRTQVPKTRIINNPLFLQQGTSNSPSYQKGEYSISPNPSSRNEEHQQPPLSKKWTAIIKKPPSTPLFIKTQINQPLFLKEHGASLIWATPFPIQGTSIIPSLKQGTCTITFFLKQTIWTTPFHKTMNID